MRLDAVAERLAALPTQLPSPAPELTPVVVDGGDVRPSIVPSTVEPVRPAGVLVLLYPDAEGMTRVVLTERTPHDGHHGGEVSFPGGKAEPDDADIVATALREATEEIGLDAAAAGLRIAAVLERFWIPVSNFEVTPVVALADRRPHYAPAPDEVVRIVEPPMSRFVPGAPIEIVERMVRDWPLRYGAYRVDGLAIWGATARILSQLGALLDDRER